MTKFTLTLFIILTTITSLQAGNLDLENREFERWKDNYVARIHLSLFFKAPKSKAEACEKEDADASEENLKKVRKEQAGARLAGLYRAKQWACHQAYLQYGQLTTFELEEKIDLMSKAVDNSSRWNIKELRPFAYNPETPPTRAFSR